MSDTVQGGAAWLAERIGHVTASRVHDVVCRLKNNGFSAARASYMVELIAELLTRLAPEHYISRALQWGTDHEGEARIAYEFSCAASVPSVGFITHPPIPDSGAS